MAQATAGSLYTVQQGDTLTSIAHQAYSDDNLWHEIYVANTQVIGNDPNLLSPGMKIYILAHPLKAKVYPTPQLCKVTSASLHIRARPTTESSIVASYPQGTTLNFIEIVEGEPVSANPHWGHSTQGHYFWMGGTDRP